MVCVSYIYRYMLYYIPVHYHGRALPDDSPAPAPLPVQQSDGLHEPAPLTEDCALRLAYNRAPHSSKRVTGVNVGCYRSPVFPTLHRGAKGRPHVY